MRLLFSNSLFIFLFIFVVGFLPQVSQAEDMPEELIELQEKEAEGEFDSEEFSLEIRKEAQKEAALSYGARGGLSKRIYEIRQDLKKQARVMDKIYDFKRLLIKAPSGLLIEPPTISEGENNLIISADGQEAAVASRIFNINDPARIVTSPRNWRSYLEREWEEVPPPPDILLPQNAEERRNWRRWVKKGWKEGYQQAEEIFQTDIDRLQADFTGMVRYRILLAQGMVSQPYALSEDFGITGGGSEMRVGDRAVTITGPSQLKPGAEQWQPADR